MAKVYEKVIIDIIAGLDVEYAKYQDLYKKCTGKQFDKEAYEIYKMKIDLCNLIINKIRKEEGSAR